MRKLRKISLLLLLLIGGCTNLPESSLPACGVDYDYMNTTIRLVVKDEMNSYLNGNEIMIVINLVDDNYSILFNSDFNNQLFLFDEKTNQWMTISNEITYVSTGEIILNSQEPLELLTVFPQLADQSVENEVYVCISGQRVENGNTTKEIVGASAIIKLEPQN